MARDIGMGLQFETPQNSRAPFLWGYRATNSLSRVTRQILTNTDTGIVFSLELTSGQGKKMLFSPGNSSLES